eukprot:IDg6682t1
MLNTTNGHKNVVHFTQLSCRVEPARDLSNGRLGRFGSYFTQSSAFAALRWRFFNGHVTDCRERSLLVCSYLSHAHYPFECENGGSLI